MGTVGYGCWRKSSGGGWCGRRPVNKAELCEECAEELRSLSEKETA